MIYIFRAVASFPGAPPRFHAFSDRDRADFLAGGDTPEQAAQRAALVIEGRDDRSGPVLVTDDRANPVNELTPL